MLLPVWCSSGISETVRQRFMPNFSERSGCAQPSTPQKTELREATRNQLFNRLRPAIEAQGRYILYTLRGLHYSDEYRAFLNLLRSEFLGQALFGSFEPGSGERLILDLFRSEPFNRVYDLIEFILENFPFVEDHKERVTDSWNQLFRSEIIAYQVVKDRVVPIPAQIEGIAIETALDTEVQRARHHISRALKELSGRPVPDTNAVIRDVIDGLEAFCKHHCGSDEHDLREAIRRLAERFGVHPQLKEAMSKLSDFANAAGIRHPKPDTQQQPLEVAVFVLTMCSAFITFIDSAAAHAQA
jgi:AbiJ N-terminal domain 4